jgi:hypothetical protein
MIEKVLLWMTAPEAYHHGPLTPNRYLSNQRYSVWQRRTYAVALDCKRVAAHVQALTIPAAINPGGTLIISPAFMYQFINHVAHLRLAELNSSAEVVLYCVYLVWSLVKL